MDAQLIQSYLAFVNDVMQSAIVIFGSSIVLYNLGYSLRDRVTRAFTALVGFVVLVYMIELLVTHTVAPGSVSSWLRAEWLGIANVPAALFHLSDALLVTTGAVSRRRRLFVRVCYVLSGGFVLLAAFSNYLVGDVVMVAGAPHLSAGPLFFLFTGYIVAATAVSLWNVWRARQRALIQTTRRRMNFILGGVLAAPLGVYPYLLLNTNPGLNLPLTFWLLLIAGNLFVGFMFGILTLQIVYFATSLSPERVVRVRLYKYLARVPLAATLVLTAYVLVQRTSSFLGLPVQAAAAFAVVATVIVTEWMIHTYKRPLERIFQLDDDPDVRRIQRLSERVVTTNELHEYLEGLLATACNALQTPTAFVVAYTAEGPKLEKAIGPLEEEKNLQQDTELQRLMQTEMNGSGPQPNDTADADASSPPENEQPPETAGLGELWEWHTFWLVPLRIDENSELLGVLGLRARAEKPNFSEAEEEILSRLKHQAAIALEDRILQQKVFAAVEGLLPQVTALQMRRSAATAVGASALTQTPEALKMLEDPDFSSIVKDALSHYWGGPKLTQSPLLKLGVVQEPLNEHDGNPTKALREVLTQAINRQRPEGNRSWTSAEWVLYNILELKFVEGRKVRDVARRLAVSESDLYRKQRVAIENVAHALSEMERARTEEVLQDDDKQNGTADRH